MKEIRRYYDQFVVEIRESQINREQMNSEINLPMDTTGFFSGAGGRESLQRTEVIHKSRDKNYQSL